MIEPHKWGGKSTWWVVLAPSAEGFLLRLVSLWSLSLRCSSTSPFPSLLVPSPFDYFWLSSSTQGARYPVSFSCNPHGGSMWGPSICRSRLESSPYSELLCRKSEVSWLAWRVQQFHSVKKWLLHLLVSWLNRINFGTTGILSASFIIFISKQNFWQLGDVLENIVFLNISIIIVFLLFSILCITGCICFYFNG